MTLPSAEQDGRPIGSSNTIRSTDVPSPIGRWALTRQFRRLTGRVTAACLPRPDDQVLQSVIFRIEANSYCFLAKVAVRIAKMGSLSSFESR
jgi:hypothetical protein